MNSTISELRTAGIPTVALGGCTTDPTDADFCLATDPYQTTYSMTKALIKAIGGNGNIVHLTGRATTLRSPSGAASPVHSGL